MTKKQMVAEIQVAEAKAWKEYRVAKHTWGEDDRLLVAKLRTKWCALFDLRDALGIPALSIESLIEKGLTVPA